ncbi:UbiA family prenyltransferase [[Limnothrix rosea] IAM M-220]|uniref:UbiA family prenyltransferase n=1 Tax=[Limnothrix rosea] IAM M-220 TaxID=454133 RepID=UPI00095E2012|nr:UbiA family prenyltransferase [[Limnothrix rosea] IAM M-220]OKH12521.1 hypothetical protein NIES208_15985 [[Limnothrix rosea] IAM M-220]
MIKAASRSQNYILKNRWWIYQKERFPIFKYGFLIAIFSGSAISYPNLLGDVTANFWGAWGVAFFVAFGCFLQMRIADEFKDYEDDCQYRPHRAVPRGLVTRYELGCLGILIAVCQLLMVTFFQAKLVFYLCLIWGYFTLMCVEFGIRQWLKAHLSIYMLSHMVILPLIALFCLACRSPIKNEYFLFCLTCFFNGIVIEIGRKIRAPQDEKVGVETYSSIWQPKTATLTWLLAIFLTAIAAILSAGQINFVIPMAVILMPWILLAAGISYWFIKTLNRKSAKWLDRMAGMWTVILYFSLGLLPFYLQF